MLTLPFLPIYGDFTPILVQAQQISYDEQYGEIFEFVHADGTIVNYFLDEELNPFTIKNGERVTLFLPLEHLQVTDPELLGIMQDGLLTNSCAKNYIINRAYPPATGVLPYTNTYDFSNEQVYNTPIFTKSTVMGTWMTFSNCIPATQRKINIGYSMYDIINDKWQSYLITGHNTLNKATISTKNTERVRFTFNRYEAVNSITITISSNVVVG